MWIPADRLSDEKAEILARLRYAPSGYVCSRQPGGEGCPVSDDEFAAFAVDFQQMTRRDVRRFSRSVWVSVGLVVLFGTRSVTFRWPQFALLTLLSFFGWFFVASGVRHLRQKLSTSR